MKINRIASAAMAALLIASMVALGACSKSYEHTFGEVEWLSTYAKEPGTTIKDSYYYSDGWFETSPETENKELALASMQLTAAAINNDENGMGAAFLRDMGFEKVGFSDFASDDPDGFNYTYAVKTLESGDKLVAVVIQSTSSDPAAKARGWRQNFIVNDPDASEPSGEHYAFAKAADSRLDEITSLGGGGTVKYWITGQSRGGAIANILAKKLGDRLSDKSGSIYAYTFEAPATVDEAAAASSAGYIHNYVCSDDLVTRLPAWGMTLYGNIHELKTDKTDEGMTAELEAMGSEAAEFRPRILAEKDEDAIIAGFEKVIPTRADYSAVRTDKWTDSDGQSHELTYSFQDAMIKLAGLMNNGTFKLSSLAGSRSELEGAIEHLKAGVSLEAKGSDPCAEYWEGAAGIYQQMEALTEGEGRPVSQEDLYEIIRLAAPVLIQIPESGEPDTSLLTDVIGYSGDLVYSHQFDTLIARLKVLAPTPEK